MAKNKPIQIYAPDDVRAQVDKRAAIEGRSQSQMALELIKKALAADKAKA